VPATPEVSSTGMWSGRHRNPKEHQPYRCGSCSEEERALSPARPAMLRRSTGPAPALSPARPAPPETLDGTFSVFVCRLTCQTRCRSCAPRSTSFRPPISHLLDLLKILNCFQNIQPSFRKLLVEERYYPSARQRPFDIPSFIHTFLPSISQHHNLSPSAPFFQPAATSRQDGGSRLRPEEFRASRQ
jgi:hypothetical protein